MGFRFSKRIKIGKGITLNLSKKGVSTTVGTRGASVNVGKRGVHLNAGIPGTGISTRTKIGGKEPKWSATNLPPRQTLGIVSSVGSLFRAVITLFKLIFLCIFGYVIIKVAFFS
jgi:hypothetical protein